MSRYGNNLVHWSTLQQLQPSGLYCGDETYEMFPDNTLIQCQLIDHYGNNIKGDGSSGNELVWCKVSDQRCFRSDNLYSVKVITAGELSEIWYSTRASLTNWPRPNDTPNGLLVDCMTDDSITGPYSNVNQDSYDDENGLEQCDCCGEKDIDPNELDDGDINLAEIGGGYAHEGCMSDDMKEEYESKIIENPEEEEMNASDIKEQLEQTLLSLGITKSQAKFITSGVKRMDGYNLKMAQTMANKGMDEAVKQMFEHPTEKRKLSYSEMRSFYG
jgi:hypothetical protein